VRCRFIAASEDSEGYILQRLAETISKLASWRYAGRYVKIAILCDFKLKTPTPDNHENVRFDPNPCLVLA
jgi:hypothetical protein